MWKLFQLNPDAIVFFSLWAHLNVGQVEFQNLSIGGISIGYGELLLNTQLGVHQNPDHDQYFSTNVDLHNFFLSKYLHTALKALIFSSLVGYNFLGYLIWNENLLLYMKKKL